MATLTPDDIHYVETVEQLYLLIRKQGLMLSPSDRDKVLAWKKADIPVQVACRAILDAIDRFRDKNGEDASLPPSLSFFNRAVRAAGKAYKESFMGEEEPELKPNHSATGKLLEVLQHVVASGKKAQDPRAKEACRIAYLGLRELAESGQMQEDGVLPLQLRTVEKTLLAHLDDSLNENERTELTECINKDFEAIRSGLGKKAQRDRWDKLWSQALWKHFQLNPLVEGFIA